MSVRFAPSPTGLFHIGNLRTAWISYQWAHALKLPWVIRFEDIDAPRSVPGAKEKQLADMKVLGLVPDVIHIQSEKLNRHWAVFLKFQKAGLIYSCTCSRQKVKEAIEGLASAPHHGMTIYSGSCRNQSKPNLSKSTTHLVWRLKMPDPTGAQDAIIARTNLNWEKANSPQDAEFVPAYHWACAIDDADGNHTLLVRAWDLAEVTPVQQAIQSHLCSLEGKAFKPAAIFHCSLVVQNDGQRLEKRTLGMTLDECLVAGKTAEWILGKFKQSFTHSLVLPKAGMEFGEEKKILKLVELGF